MERDVFRYFEGGRSGVKQRLAEQIRQGLETYKLDGDDLESHANLPAGTIAGICGGNINVIDARVIEQIQDPVGLDIGEAFGSFVAFDEETERYWTEQANQEQFVPVGGSDPTGWTERSRAQLFVFFRALDSLFESSPSCH